jgi:hypothetical protein
VIPALKHMVQAAKTLRQKLASSRIASFHGQKLE